MKKELEISLIEVMLRLSAIEALLIDKKIISNEEMTTEMKNISETVQSKILEMVNKNKDFS